MGAAPPLISVIIPNHNYGRYLGQAIESVLGQSYSRVEVIVVDDGSTDDSMEVLRRFGDRIRWLQQPRQGVSAARNRGIQATRGELIAFLDSDDVWHPEKLARQLARLSRPSVGMVYCGRWLIDDAGRCLGIEQPRHSGWVLREIALLRWAQAPGGSSALVRKDCLDRVGLFDPQLSTSADWDLWRRIACRYEIRVVPEPLVSYRQHPSAMHRNVELFERDMLRAFGRMFEDSSAAAVHPLRRRCYSNLYLMCSGAYLHAGRWDKSLAYAWRSVLEWPLNVATLASFPVRRLSWLVSHASV
ncbi:MAG: glycosyltransferase [Candidatus Omnitrophica bacterium]|nr:glycosyltransferase [Candidatus Omnitrophota bacterium]